MTIKPPNTSNPAEGEPADLSELTATDALLDRLGGRNATENDLLDPTATALLELLAVIDEPVEPDIGLGRLVEVLDGRPLYLAGPDESAELLHRDGVDTIDLDIVDDGVLASRVIDLTDHTNEEDSDDGDDAEIAAPIPLLPAARAWARAERALRQVSLPAASVLLLLAVSGGVSAAVTGNPMAPVNGVTRVMAQLPGGDNSQRSLSHVKGEISAADSAIRKNDALAASRHLAAARLGLPGVPDDQKQQLSVLIANFQTMLTTPPGPVVVPTPPVGVEATTPPLDPTPSESSGPSATATPAEPTADPTTEEEPSSDPSVSPATPETSDPGNPSPDPTDSGS